MSAIPTPQQLSELFWYDAINGDLIRRIDGGRWGREKAGTIVGSKMGNGYISITAYGKRYLAHRVAFAIANGEWPDGNLDHIDGDRANNRLLNLRVATPAENIQNQRGARGKTASGFLGVSRDKKRWKAEIKIDGKKHYLGSFDNPQDAHEAYLLAKRKLHPFCTI